MDSILYFAYGSNMLAERLKRRCPSALVQGVAVAEDYGLAFSKIGQDGSGKATLIAAEGLRTYGVVFQVSMADLSQLDRFEGRGNGYDRLDEFHVRSAEDGGATVTAATYLSTPPYVDDSLMPFDWYLDLVTHGALQHGLPSAHLHAISRTQYVVDSELGRPQRLEALDVLAQVSDIRAPTRVSAFSSG